MMVVLFSTVAGETGFGVVFSRDRTLGRGRDEYRGYLWEYSIEIKWRPINYVRHSEERPKMTSLLLQIQHV